MIDITTLTFIWPKLLWLLLAVPLLGIYYIALALRRAKVGRRYASLEIIGEASLAAAGAGAGGRISGMPIDVAGSRTGAKGAAHVKPSRFKRWRHHIAPTLMLFAVAMLIFAVTRPQAVVLLPSRVETIMLALDMSGSMRATDVKPTRMSAAQTAAKNFIEDQPRQMQVGVVGVAAAAAVVQSPTTNRADIMQAIDRLQPQRGTALGSGIIIALHTLLPGSAIDVAKLIGDGGPPPPPVVGPQKPPPPMPAATPGSNSASAIVLVTDGQSNTGPDPLKAADIAAEHGVRVFTVGIGTPEGINVSVDGYSLRVRLDEETLKKVATVTGGEYFRASTSTDLKKIYRLISAKMAMEKSHVTEVTAIFVALGALLAMIAALLSLSWYNRIV